jgi:cell wall-associated NlpC family hydrolase
MLGVSLFLVLFQSGKNNSNQMGSCTLKDVSPQVQKLVGASSKTDKRLQELLPKYKKAAEKYNIPWEYLAAIHKAETNNGQTPKTEEERKRQTSDKGAVGPGQFMWRTWVGWTFQVVKDFPGTDRTPFFRLGDLNLTPEQEKEIIKVKYIKKYNGEGVDANGDGYANPWDEDDAIEATAKKFAKDGGADGNFSKAILTYNRSTDYLNKVNGFAKQFSGGATFECSDESFLAEPAPENVKRMIERAIKEMPNIIYVFGGNTPPTNGRQGRLDCSSFVQWLYREYLGIDLPRTTFEQVKKGVEVPRDQMRPGDLIFFDSHNNNTASHVGMYIGDGKMIHNARTGVNVKIVKLSEYHNRWVCARRYFK